jgi:tetratricopeptide (TPR) repeat protein
MKEYFFLFLIIFSSATLMGQTIESLIEESNNHMYKGNYKEADKVYDRIISLFPNRPEGYTGKGYVCYYLENYKSGISYFNQALEKDAYFVIAYNGRSLIRFRLEDYQGALKDVNTSISIYPNQPEVYLLRGNCYHFLGNTIKACPEWRKAKQMGFPGTDYWLQNFCQ